VSAKILIPGSNASNGGVELWYYASPDCSGALAGAYSLPLSAATSWQKVTATTTVPAAVHSAAVRLVVLKPFTQQAAEALFDDVVVTKQ
jgi:hypothetical protein